MKDPDDIIIVRSHDFEKAITSFDQGLVFMEFKQQNSQKRLIKTNLKRPDDVIFARSRDFENML